MAFKGLLDGFKRLFNDFSPKISSATQPKTVRKTDQNPPKNLLEAPKKNDDKPCRKNKKKISISLV